LNIPVKEVADHLAAMPTAQREAILALRGMILKVIPDAVDVISYSMSALKLDGKVVVGYEAFKNHCSFILWSGSTLTTCKEAVAGYETSKSTLHFTPDNPLPEELVRLLVHERLKEIAAARKAKGKKNVAKTT